MVPPLLYLMDCARCCRFAVFAADGYAPPDTSIAAMTARIRQTALAVLLLAASGGCTATWVPDWAYWDPWWEPNEPFEPPIVRIEKLRAMRDELDGMSIAQRTVRAEHLAHDFSQEKDPVVREEIIRTLTVCGTPPAAAPLRMALQDDDKYVRLAACSAFGKFGGEEGIRSLALALQDKDRDVKLAALRALSQVDDPAAVQLLAGVLHDRDAAIQQRAMRSLEEITGKYYGDDVDAWTQFARGQTPPEQRRSLVEVIGVDPLWFR